MPPTTPTSGSPSGTVQLKYGDLIITKQDPAETANSVDMAGAEFAVYAVATLGSNDCSTAVNGTAIATGAIVASTDPLVIDNTVTIKGLKTSDFYNNTSWGTDTTKYQYYCLVETKAPVGYNLNPEPISFTVMQKFTGDPAVPILATFAQPVNNEKANLGNNLPLTGGEGVAALSLGGLALIGGGVGYYAYTSRKRRTA